jgi:uncharacterized RDD family membrane protein YckC
MSTPEVTGVAGAAPCGACGAALEPGAAFCGSCGARVPGAGAAAARHDASAARTDPSAPARPGEAARRDPRAPTPGPGAGPGTAARWSLGADVDDAVAPVWRRLVALLVDQALAVLVGSAGLVAVLPALRSDGSVGALLVPGLLLLLLAAGQWFAEAFGGRTVGGALLGTRTVSARTGRAPGLWAVLVRSVVQAAGVLLAGVGVYVVAGSGAWDEDPEQRGWHDKAAGTLVLRARAPRREDPAPEPAAPASVAPETRPTAPTSGPPRSAVVPAPQASARAEPRVAPTSGPPAAAESLAAEVAESPVPDAAESPVPDVLESPAPDVLESPVPDAPESLAPALPVPPPSPTSAANAPAVPATPPEAPARPTVPVPPVAHPAPPAPRHAASSAPSPAGPPPAAPEAPTDLPDTTVPTASLGDLEHTRVGRWAGSLDAASTLALVLDTGERVTVTGPGLVGRRPAPGTEQWAHLVTVDDPGQSVSSTHLAFWPVDGGLDVLDRGSTNGTVLLDAAGKPWSLPPGQPARVGAGWTLVLGSRRITVTTA